MGKRNKRRWVPAHSYLVSVYAAHLGERAAIRAADESDIVVVNLKGGEIDASMTTSRARRIVSALAKRAGIGRHVTPHQFRHGSVRLRRPSLRHHRPVGVRSRDDPRSGASNLRWNAT